MILSSLRADLAFGLSLLTRLPVSWLGRAEQSDLARSVWSWPIAGALSGLVGGLGMMLFCRLGMPPFVASFWSVGLQILLTGALHEDGLADMADGLGGGRNAEHALSIMRDSRIGAFGAIALLVVVGARITALGTLGGDALGPLVAAAALSRAAMAMIVIMLRPARHDGLASAMKIMPARMCCCLTVAVSVVLISMVREFSLYKLIISVLVTIVVSVLVARAARRCIGGYTGDILGAGAAFGEAALLSVMAGFARS